MIPKSYQLKFELRHLRSFLTIAEELNYRKAASKLHIAQPALSRQITQLEEAIGCKVFDRTKRNIRLTNAGQFLYEKLPGLIEQIQSTTDQAHKIAKGMIASLKFGYSSAAMSSFLPAVIREIRSTLEGCEFYFSESTSDKLINDVISERLDAAFILYRPENKLLKTIRIRSEKIGVILPDNHRLARKKIIAAKDLIDETLILFPRVMNPIMYDEIIAYCQQAGFSPKAIREAAPRSTAIGLVAAGEGIATIAESLKHTCVSGTKFRPLEQPGPEIEFSCITRSDRTGRWLDILAQIIKRDLS